MIPTDFSPVSDNALNYAIELAEPFDAGLTIFHAYQIPIAIEQDAGAILQQELMDHEILTTHQQLTQFTAHHPRLKGMRYQIVAKPGSLTESVKMITKEDENDLIIMGTKGAEGIKELLMGTNTADIVNDADIPVMVIPGNVNFKGITSIAFAYDYKGINDPHKLDIMEILAKKFNADIHILNISESKEPERDDDLASMEIFQHRFNNIKHDYKFHLGKDIEGGICEYVQTNKISLLAAMPRKHNFFEKIFKKSLTNKLTFHTNVPLLLLKN